MTLGKELVDNPFYFMENLSVSVKDSKLCSNLYLVLLTECVSCMIPCCIPYLCVFVIDMIASFESLRVFTSKHAEVFVLIW